MLETVNVLLERLFLLNILIFSSFIFYLIFMQCFGNILFIFDKVKIQESEKR